MALAERLAQLADPRWRRFYLQRRFMRPAVREWIADRIAVGRRQPPRDAGRDDRLEELRATGQVALGACLTPEQCDEIRAYFAQREVVDLYRPGHPRFLPHGEGRHPDCHVANHDDLDIVDAPYLLELANRPDILSLLHRYFGCEPLISYLGCWWSYPTPAGPQQAENFHRDVDDWRFIKLFVYLTDVDDRTGPHVYVRSSAQAAELASIKRFQDREVFDAFGRQPVAARHGKAGTAFLENTFGLHKGTQVDEGRRLLFQAVYSLHPIPYGPRRPIAPLAGRLADDEATRRINRVYLS